MNANALHNAFAAKDLVFSFEVNFGFLGCFDAANPIIASRRSTFKVFLLNSNVLEPNKAFFKKLNSVFSKYHFHSPVQNIPTKGIGRSVHSAQAVK